MSSTGRDGYETPHETHKHETQDETMIETTTVARRDARHAARAIEITRARWDRGRFVLMSCCASYLYI